MTPKALFTKRQIGKFDFIKIKLFHCRKQAYDYQGGHGGGMNWKIGININDY